VPPDLTFTAATAVLAWGDERRRDLPWRRTRDRWAVLVAEVMLQQTQVARVIPKWEAFLAAYADPTAAAAAPLADVLALWQGLGYPRRGANLWRTAQVCVERFDGVVPDTLDDLLTLPGVGPYTARAVQAFADEGPVGVVDTNIARVLARVAGTRLRPRPAQEMADGLVPAGRSWAWNQTLMDVGAELCRPVPRCPDCPLAPWCAWHLAGRPEPDPAVGTAGVSGRQARFEGSDRQGRGRLLAALTVGPVDVTDAPGALGWPADADRSARVVADLARSGWVRRLMSRPAEPMENDRRQPGDAACPVNEIVAPSISRAPRWRSCGI
jgi:A/G-specific adenine glycosylase